MVVILMGPPGAGKGTHAGPLSHELALPHISTGDLFRENIRNQTPLGLKAKEFIDQGKLVPDDLVLDMLFNRISKDDCKQGYLLDGFPRTVAQAQAFEQRLGSSSTLLALHFAVEDEALVERITGRLSCKQCSRPHHLKFDPPKAPGQCDSCGGPLYQRDDDREEVLRKRLEVYHTQTEPLIAHFSKKEGLLLEVDSIGSKEEVFHRVLETLDASH
ncbi:MAG: adenylate kinase [Verrucomicrobiota bacterium]|nr:adenylate kinase [Verrucomicrobiota bacterium]